MTDILTKLKSVLEKEGYDVAGVKLDSNLEADLGIDSLGQIELMIAVEEAFGIEIPDEDAEAMTTVGDVVRIVEGKVK